MKSFLSKKKGNLQNLGTKGLRKPKMKLLSLSMTMSKSHQSGWKATYKPYRGRILSDQVVLPSLGQLTVYNVISSDSGRLNCSMTLYFLKGNLIYPEELLRLVHGLQEPQRSRVAMKVLSIILKPATWPLEGKRSLK